MKRFDLTAYDGKLISVVEWEVEKPRGIVQISHGMAEHALRYSLLAEYLNSRGYLVVCDDHRAHGLTDPTTLGYCAGDIFEDTLKDMSAISKLYRERYPDLRIVLLGHSYGSFLTQAYIERYNKNIDAAVIGGSNKMTGISAPFGKLVAKGKLKKSADKPGDFFIKITFDAYNKKFTGGSFISSIPEECKRYDDDKQCGFKCSNAFYYYFFKGLTTLYTRENLNKLNKDVKLLLIAGASDPVGNMGKGMLNLLDMYKKEGVKDVELKLFEGVRHEYFNDVSREEAFKLVADFCDSI